MSLARHVIEATVYPNMGGSSVVLLASARALKSRGKYRVTVRAPFAGADSQARHAFPLMDISGWRRRLGVVPTLLRLLVQEFRFLSSLPGTGKEILLHVHDTPSLYIYGILSRLMGIPLLWHVHFSEGRGLAGWLRRNLCDAMIHISRAARTGECAKEAGIIQNPLPESIPAPSLAKKAKGNNGTLNLVMAGSICPRKNQELAIRAVACLAAETNIDIVLHIFGAIIDHDYYDMLNNTIKAANIDRNVVFHGFVPSGHLSVTDAVFLQLSTYENQPLSVIEALAAGIRVIVSDIPAHRELWGDLDLPEAAIVPVDVSSVSRAITSFPPWPGDEIAERTQKRFSQKVFGDNLSMFIDRLFDH